MPGFMVCLYPRFCTANPSVTQPASHLAGQAPARISRKGQFILQDFPYTHIHYAAMTADQVPATYDIAGDAARVHEAIMSMRIELLADHRHLITKIAALLHDEWGAFPPWASLLAIEERLAAGSQSYKAPFTLVALSAENDFLGTASIKRFELPAHHDKEHWLGEVFIPKGLRGKGIGSSLIGECIKRSFDLGVQALYLYTPDQQRLYERFGWHEALQTVVNDEPVSIMVKHATQPIIQHGLAQ